MANKLIADSTRVLFILNNDYGELGLAMYFLQGRNLASSTTLLLPPRLFAKNRNTLPGETCEYETVEDIIRTVETLKPDIVFLFSGYILPLHGVISLDDMTHLVQVLSKKDCKVVTSDPFFGIYSRMDPANTSGPEALRLFETEILAGQPWEYRLSMTLGNIQILEKFVTASNILKDTIHLYYTCSDPQDEPIEVTTDTVTFFNPSLIYQEEESSSSGAATSGNVALDAAEQQHWLFILGSVDYDLQIRLYGEEEFLDLLEKKLDQTLQAGRRPVFIAPSECVDKLVNRVPISARKDLLTFCSYEDFSSLLLKAEYVFYWNLASYSTFLRVINGLPMFMFDEGHLVRHVKPMYERMLHWYYQNWKPPSLDPHAALNTDVLAELSKDYEQDTGTILKNLQKLPSPEQLIEDLLYR